MHKVYAIIFIGFLSVISKAGIVFENEFGKSTNYDEGLSVVVLDSANYLISAAYLDVSNSSNWQPKLYYLNNILDSTSVFDQPLVSGYMNKSQDGNLLFFGGNTAGFNYDSIQISKTNISGQLIWKTNFRIDCKNTVTDLKEDNSGYIYISGFYSKSGCNLPVYNAFIIKMTANGQIVWSRYMDGGKNDQLHQLSIDPQGNIIASGWSNSYNNRGDSDFYFVKYDPDGNELLSNTLNYESQDYAYGLETDDFGNIYISGYSNQVELFKFNPKGIKEYNQRYFQACGGSNFRIKKTAQNTLLMLGTEYLNNSCQSFFMETDMQGNILWKYNWNARLRNFEIIKEGSYILTGYKDILPKVYVVKFDSLLKNTDTTSLVTDSNNIQPNSDQVDDIETALNDIDKQNLQLNIYPNPFVNNVYVKWEDDNRPKEVVVYNMNAQVVAHFNISSQQNLVNIDGSSWASGTYLLNFLFSDNTSTSKKIQKY